MTINKAKFERVVQEAKAKTDNKRWIAAIEKAADAILNGKWVVTQLFHCWVFTTQSGKTYRANGVCQCEAFFRDQPCKHRAGARLLNLYQEMEAAPVAAPRITRGVERDPRNGVKVVAVRCDGWLI
jgi:hypothetical protein